MCVCAPTHQQMSFWDSPVSNFHLFADVPGLQMCHTTTSGFMWVLMLGIRALTLA